MFRTHRTKKSKTLRAGLLTKGLCLALGTLGMAGPALADEAYFIQNVRVFTGAEIIESTNVLTDGQRIIGIGVDFAPPPSAQIVDGTGKTLMPGLVNAHAHTFTVNASTRGAAVWRDDRGRFVR